MSDLYVYALMHRGKLIALFRDAKGAIVVGREIFVKEMKANLQNTASEYARAISGGEIPVFAPIGLPDIPVVKKMCVRGWKLEDAEAEAPVDRNSLENWPEREVPSVNPTEVSLGEAIVTKA